MKWVTLIIVAAGIAVFLVLKQLGQVSGAKAKEYLAQGAKVIDVRTPAEFDSGHLPQAVNIPLGELEQQITRVAPNRDQLLLLHCLSGTRSGMARRTLQRMGYTRVFNLGSYGRAARIVGTDRR
jgi:phage shock protein E